MAALTVALVILATPLHIEFVNATSILEYSNNYSLGFDGLNDYASCLSPIYTAYALTIELWVKPEYTIQMGSDANYGHVLGAIISSTATWVGSGNNQGGWALYFDFSDGHLYFKCRKASYYIEIVTVGTNRNFWNSSSWYHIAVTYSSGLGLALYVNKTVDKTIPHDGQFIYYDTSELDVGGYLNSGFMFQGLIDEVRLWNVSRTYGEISDCWNRVLNTTECANPNLIGYWRFDEGTGTESIDHSIQGNSIALGLAPNDPTWNGLGAPIVAEFPSILILPILMTVTLLAAIVYKRKHIDKG